MENIKIAYIGGGSKNWARTFMMDLTLNSQFSGEIALYDIDFFAAQKNQVIGRRMNNADGAMSNWNYVACDNIDDALDGANFVVISILPGTFDDMEIDVHMPEQYGIYQSVGDTVGPGGIFRGMRTVPIFEMFATKIQEICPEAWVINLTNPMYLCTKTLYDVFPDIKAIGCCHEVFGAQDFLCDVIADIKQIPRPRRNELITTVSGINHFTWIINAKYKDINVFSLLPEFIQKYYEQGYIKDREKYNKDPFQYGHKIKMDLFLRFGALAAAGDRHLVEFLNNTWYLKNKETAESWYYHLTSVDYRKKQQEKQIALTERLVDGTEPIVLKRSGEELVQIINALLGNGKHTTNCNMINMGQMNDLPLGTIVETECEFDKDIAIPVKTKDLPIQISNLVYRNAMNLESTYYGIKTRDFNMIFESFMNQPLCSTLSIDDGLELFAKMIKASSHTLKEFGL